MDALTLSELKKVAFVNLTVEQEQHFKDLAEEWARYDLAEDPENPRWLSDQDLVKQVYHYNAKVAAYRVTSELPVWGRVPL